MSHLLLHREHTTITTFLTLASVFCERVFIGIIQHYLHGDAYLDIYCGTPVCLPVSHLSLFPLVVPSLPSISPCSFPRLRSLFVSLFSSL